MNTIQRLNCSVEAGVSPAMTKVKVKGQGNKILSVSEQREGSEEYVYQTWKPHLFEFVSNEVNARVTVDGQTNGRKLSTSWQIKR